MKIKTHLNIILVAFLVFATVPACSLTSSPIQSSPVPSSQPSASSPDIVPTRNSQVLGDLGSISYTLDTARQVSQTFDFLTGGDILLTTTDANGYGWMLSIPADALFLNETITMTPFATLDASQSEAKLISGVQLEPDGLQFTDVVRLSVTAPSDKPGVGLIFSMNQDGSNVAFAPTTNTSGGKTAIADIWHFSSAGTDNADHGGNDTRESLQERAYADFLAALDAADEFIKNPPRPPEAPRISMFCRGTQHNPELEEAYEYMRDFSDPYREAGAVLMAAEKNMILQDIATEADHARAFNVLVTIMQIAEKNLLELGKQYEKDKPPDSLIPLIRAALQVEYMLGMINGDVELKLFPYVIQDWAVTLRDYYLNELKTKHDYRAWPGVFTLEYEVALLGGTDRFQELMETMTFEVILDTSFDGTWYSSGNLYATGNVVQTADVMGLKLETSGIDFWGDLNNLQLKVKTGTFTNPTGTYPVPSPYNGQVWLKNFDACVTKSFDVVISGFSGIEDVQANRNVAGAASRAALKQYWWGAGFFMFTVPMRNLNPTLGDQTFTGSGSAGEGAFTGNGKIHIVIKQ